MLLALKFIAAIALLAALHITVMALLGRLLGIAIREVSFGLGPTLLAVGVLRLRVLPLGGAVDFDDFESQPRAVRVLLPLAGVASLAVVAFALHPSALSSMAHGFAQIVAGALGPTSHAQQLIGGAARVGMLGFVPLLGMLAAKLAAFNLMPLPAMNGGAALLALLDPRPREMPRWKETLVQGSAWLMVALALAWVVAIGTFLLAHTQ
jgi:membrane-associated protease RseP (regulator of RpoE activity)